MQTWGRTGRVVILFCALLPVLAGACRGPEAGSGRASDGASGRDDAGAANPAPGPTGPDLGGLRLGLAPVASGLEAPLFAAHSGDDSGRLYVVEQTGAIRIVEDGRVRAQPFLDLGDEIVAGGEQGLLGLAFHPGYARNGRLFVNYTDLRGDTVVAEYRRAPEDELRAQPTATRVLLTIDQPFTNHNGGALAFGPDGYLYVATGDGGGTGDPFGNGQALDTLLGKLLRIDVDSGGNGAYGIPPDNPFVERDDARAEVWAYGLRNPWRFSFDAGTSTLWIGDVGQGDAEEINRAPAAAGGLNYGWNIMEGTSCYQPPEGCERSGLEQPVTTYTHAEGCSVTGGYVYRGSRHPALRGVYLFADYCSGTIWGLDATRAPPSQPVELLSTDRALSSFGADRAGELYVTDLAAGELLRIVDGG
jgi:glucose/arabinose dehydrogenase